MKQFTLKSLMLLLLLLIGGGSYAWGEDFVKVTNAPDSWEGSYLFVYEAGNVCFDGSLQKLDVTKNTKGVIIKDGVIAATDELKACCFTVTADSQNKGWYQIKSASNFYIAGTVKTHKPQNGLASTDQEAEASDYLNRFEVDGKGVSVYSQSKDGETVLRFNKAKDQQRFRYYKTGQEPIALYKLSSTATLTSIAVSGTPTNKTYFDGEAFDPTGLVVRGPALLVVAAVMAVRINPKMSATLLIMLPIIIVIVALIMKFGFPMFQKMQKKVDNVNRVVQENLIGMRVVKAFVREEHEKDKFHNSSDELAKQGAMASGLIVTVMPVMMLLFNAVIVFTYYKGALSANEGVMQVGQISVFASYVVQILMNLVMISMMLLQLARGKACV